MKRSWQTKSMKRDWTERNKLLTLLIVCACLTCEFTRVTTLNSVEDRHKSLLVVPPFSKLPVEVSPTYMNWSKWQHDSVMMKRLKNREKLNNPLNNIRTELGVTAAADSPLSKTDVFMRTAYVSHIDSNSKKSTTTRTNVKHTTEGYNIPNSRYNGTVMNQTYSAGSTYSTGASVVLAFLTALISFVTIAGNILVLLSFFVERALRTATNYFIASLAVTDLLIGIFSMNFYTLYLLLGRWPLGRLSCDLWLTLDYTACLTSQYTVLFITVDRFFSVKLPGKYRNWRTDYKVNIMVAATWIIPTSVFFPTIMAWPYFNSNVKPRPTDLCYAEFANDPIFNTIFTLCYFWVTLCVMFGLYADIYKVAVHLQQKSDEKRNRVSGLVSSTNVSSVNIRAGGSQRHNLSYSSKLKTKLTHLPPSSSSLADANESSAYDSDEEHKRRLEQKSKASKSSKPNASNGKQLNSGAPILVKTVLNGKFDGLTNAIHSSTIKNDHLTCIEPAVKCTVNEHNSNCTANSFPGLPSNVVTQSCKPIPEGPNCVENHTFFMNGQNDSAIYSPFSVSFYEKDGVHIVSPILTDDESSLVEYLDHSRQGRLPTSPALCICSDVEDDSNTLWFTDMAQKHNEKIASSIKHSECSERPVNVELIQAKKDEKKTKEYSNTITDPNALSDRQTAVSNYQDRVMQMFLLRLANRNPSTQEISDPKTRLTPGNATDTLKSSKNFEEITSQSQHPGRLSNTNTRYPTAESQSATDLNNTAVIRENTLTGNFGSALEAPTSNLEQNHISPIWKPQVSSEMDTVHTTCSLHGLVYYNPSDGSQRFDPSNECLLCVRHQDSDTINSSSSYDEYLSRELVEKRIFCCTVGIREVQQKRKSVKSEKVHSLQVEWSNCSQSIVALMLRIPSMLCTSKGKREPVERSRRENRARKALRTITFILGAFVLCWTPYHVVIMIKGICDDVAKNYTCVNELFYSVTYWLCYMNSPINPFCYALANAQFKKTFIRIFHGDFRRS